jgi:glycosyltransferase involved in cell wall biosynthesis
MAADLSVVAYQIGGVGEAIVHGETGFLVPFGNIEILAQSIQQLIENPVLRFQMGGNGHRRLVEFYTAERTAYRVTDVIEETLHHNREVR